MGALLTDMMSVRGFSASIAETMGVTDRQVRKMVAAGGSLTPEHIAALCQAPRLVTWPIRNRPLKGVFKGVFNRRFKSRPPKFAP